PGPGVGISDSTSLKLSRVGSPWGRDARRIWRLLVGMQTSRRQETGFFSSSTTSTANSTDFPLTQLLRFRFRQQAVLPCDGNNYREGIGETEGKTDEHRDATRGSRSRGRGGSPEAVRQRTTAENPRG